MVGLGEMFLVDSRAVAQALAVQKSYKGPHGGSDQKFGNLFRAETRLYHLK
jgi:hypothetical protein